jgi:hypothetical protein
MSLSEVPVVTNNLAQLPSGRATIALHKVPSLRFLVNMRCLPQGFLIHYHNDSEEEMVQRQHQF